MSPLSTYQTFINDINDDYHSNNDDDTNNYPYADEDVDRIVRTVQWVDDRCNGDGWVSQICEVK